jgi:hypothetical protein
MKTAVLPVENRLKGDLIERLHGDSLSLNLPKYPK